MVSTTNFLTGIKVKNLKLTYQQGCFLLGGSEGELVPRVSPSFCCLLASVGVPWGTAT